MPSKGHAQRVWRARFHAPSGRGRRPNGFFLAQIGAAAVAGPRYSGDAEHGRNHFLQTGVASRHGVPATTEAQMTNTVLGLMGDKGASFEPLLRNTANPPVIRTGEQINVSPSRVEV